MRNDRHSAAMAKILVTLILGLAGGLAAAWWWLGGPARSLVLPGDQLAAWVEVTGAESIPVDAGGTTWIVSATIHMRNVGTSPLTVNIPAQRFLLVRKDGSTVAGNLASSVMSRIGSQQTASVPLPKTTFFATAQDTTSIVLALEQGDGLRIIPAPIGKAPPKDAAPAVEPSPAVEPNAGKG